MSALPDTDAFLEALHNEVLRSKLPDPPESAIQYRPPPGTYDGAMAREVRPAMPDNMPNFAQKPPQGDGWSLPAPTAPGTNFLGGRGMATMMDSSPPIRPLQYARELHVGAGGMTPEDQTSDSATLRDNGGTSWNSPVTPGTWGREDLPARAAPQGADIVSLLRGMFQGAQ